MFTITRARFKETIGIRIKDMFAYCLYCYRYIKKNKKNIAANTYYGCATFVQATSNIIHIIFELASIFAVLRSGFVNTYINHIVLVHIVTFYKVHVRNRGFHYRCMKFDVSAVKLLFDFDPLVCTLSREIS